MTRLTPTIRARADKTVTLTLDEARSLPNMLGRIAPAMLKAHGYYTATIDGRRTLYILMENSR